MFEVWPENWQAFAVFCQVQTQWRIGGMGSPTGLDYTALYPLMQRLNLGGEDWDQLFADIQTLEFAALQIMNEKT